MRKFQKREYWNICNIMSFLQSMHWAKLNTKDRMLTDDAGSSDQFQDACGKSRRASEGGANIYCKPKSGFKWEKQSTNEVISKFRNYEI